MRRVAGVATAAAVHGLIAIVLWQSPSRQREQGQATPIQASLLGLTAEQAEVPRLATTVPQMPIIDLDLPILSFQDEVPAAAPAMVPVATNSAASTDIAAPLAHFSTALKVGEGGESLLEPPRFDADYLDNPQPDYPRLSRKRREEGTVLLRVMVSVGGTASRITVEKSSGFSRLDMAALQAVQSWRFIPARRGTQTVESWVIVPVVFSLSS
jgi:periplasmic protein TonB